MQYAAQQDTKALLDLTGHVLGVADFDDLAELDRLAALVAHGPETDDEDLLCRPFLVGGVAFFPLTLGKTLFWRDVLTPLFADDEILAAAALLWLGSIADFDYDSAEYGDPGNLKRTIARFARRCRLSPSQIARAVGEYLDTENNAHATARQYGQLIALLVREYGATAKHWLKAPLAEIELLIADWNRKVEDEAREARGRASRRGRAIAPLPSPKFKYSRQYREARERLEEKWRSADSK